MQGRPPSTTPPFLMADAPEKSYQNSAQSYLFLSLSMFCKRVDASPDNLAIKPRQTTCSNAVTKSSAYVEYLQIPDEQLKNGYAVELSQGAASHLGLKSSSRVEHSFISQVAQIASCTSK